MATKIRKLPDGMQILLDRIGMDTQTARLCALGDWVAAKEWVNHVLGMIPVTIPILNAEGEETGDREPTGELEHGHFAFLERRDDGPKPTRQNDVNASRAEAYSTIVALLETVVDAGD